MAVLSKQGGRRYPQLTVTAPDWFEQSKWLISKGKLPPGTLTRLVLVGFRNRTVVVNPR